MIELKNISVGRSGQVVLQDVTLTVPSSSFVSVLGESGAGKTTLLNVISGLLPQDSGQVLFDGENVDDIPAHKRNVAVVFQDARLFPNMNVLDNVAFPLKMQGLTKAQRYEIAQQRLADVRLSGLEQRRTNELSGGQRQRVALARALAGNPHALLLDEPFSGLDESLRDDMRHLVLSLHKDTGTTMLMVTHDAREALFMSDYVAYMADGVVLQSGTPDQVLLSPSSEHVSQSFGATMAIEGAVANEVFSCRKLIVPAPGVADGAAVLLRTHEGAVTIHPLTNA